ncbi:MAG: proprotein convertase P-domain-containing protein, partial [Deltaproteobacteria bacterium]|nr:proprotein convertase P-domain-containing protein [Deltaproteobacteria bacterium]
GDCDDGDAANYTGNAEVCDGQDNDCDGNLSTDEIDDDSDGQTECDGDCDDNDINNFSGNPEVCDSADNDCDGFLGSDEIDDDTDGETECDGDCDDGDSAINTSAVEICDGVDNDCDGTANAPLPPVTYEGTTDLTGGQTRTRGNKYFVTTSVDVDTIAMYLDAPAGTTLNWVVYESATELGTYTLLSTTTTTAPGGGRQWLVSDPIGTALTAGNYYVLGAHWGPTSVGYTYEVSPALPVLAPFGELVGGASSDPDNLAVPAATYDTWGNLAQAYSVEIQALGESDIDADLSPVCDDCDDADGANFPGNAEVCDGSDNDCDDETGFGDATSEDLNNSPFTWANGSYIGNTYTVTSSAQLLDIEAWIADTDADAVVTAIVFAREDSADDWEFVESASIPTVPTTADWALSDPLEVTLIEGWEYSIGVHHTGSLEHDHSAAGVDPTWGTFIQFEEDEEADPLPLSTYDTELSGATAIALRLNSTTDLDLDGDGSAQCDGDCDDTEPSVLPSGLEICDGYDNDCLNGIDDLVDHEPVVIGGGAGTAIPDGPNGQVTVTATVLATDPIVDIDVRLDIDHTFVADLEIFLTSPGGTVVELTTDNGGSGNDFIGTVFDDEAVDPITGIPNTGSYTGRYIPEGALSGFDGENPAGTWSLAITDDAGADTGTVVGWELRFNQPLEGASANCAAGSCDDVLLSDATAPDGAYWLDPDGGGAYEAWCDMTTDGGGWTLILKAAGDSTFGYTDALWENTTLLNEDSLDDDASQNAKYESFVDVPALEVRGCFPQDSVCIYADPLPGTALDIFSGGDEQIGTGFDGQLPSAWSAQPNCQWFGFNSPYQYQATRFGFTANQENDCQTNDTALGFGVGPTSGGGTNYGAGELCLSTQCSQGNVNSGFEGLLWVR